MCAGADPWAKARSAIASAENREPMIRMAAAPSAAKHLPASNEGPENRVGQFGLGAHQPAELVELHHQHAARLRDPRREVRPLTGQHVQLAEKGRPARGHDRVTQEDLDVAVGPPPPKATWGFGVRRGRTAGRPARTQPLPDWPIRNT